MILDAAADPTAPVLGGRHRPRLLIADDDPVVRSVVGTQVGGSFDVVAVAADATDSMKAYSNPDGTVG